jgi:hypothetical protein
LQLDDPDMETLYLGFQRAEHFQDMTPERAALRAVIRRTMLKAAAAGQPDDCISE